MLQAVSLWRRPHIGPDTLWVGSCVAIGAALRIALLLTSLSEITADEAVPGLQARHIWLLGQRPAVDYENAPHGSLEMYLTAMLFALTGSSSFALRIVPMLFGLAFVVVAYALGRVTRSREVGRLSALYAAVGPAFLEIWQLKAGSGYVIVLALGAGSLLVLDRLTRGGWKPIGWALLGALLGIGFWTHPVMFYFWAVSVLVLALAAAGWWRGRRSAGEWALRAGSVVVAMAAGMAAGLAPLIAYNAGHDWVTIRTIGGPEAGLPPPWRAFVREFYVAGPVMLGFTQPTSAAAAARQLIAENRAWHGLGTLVAIALFTVTLARGRSSFAGLLRWRLPRDRAAPMIYLLALTPVLFSFSGFRDFLGEPRYLMPAFAALPVAVDAMGGAGRRSLVLRRAIVGVALAVNLLGVVRIEPSLNLPHVDGVALASSNSPLTEFLTARGLTRFYGDYWTVYPVMFESRERVLGSAIEDGASVGWNRYIPAAHSVAMAVNPAVVQVAGTAGDRAFRALLAERGISYQHAGVGVYTVYWDLSRRVFDVRSSAGTVVGLP